MPKKDEKKKKTFSSLMVEGEKRYVKDDDAHEKIDSLQIGIDSKQDKLIAGEGITLEGNIISSSVGTVNYNDLENKPSINGVELSGNKTASDLGINSAEWGNIVGDIDKQEDLKDLLSSKQDELIPGGGIEIVNNTISLNLKDWIIFDCGDSVSDITNYDIDSEGNVTIITYWGTIRGELDRQNDLKARLKSIESEELTPQEIEKILYLNN